MDAPTPPQASSDATDVWRRLLYRWFVEFNPLYLLSAALVLTGCFLLARGLASSESLWASARITLVSEVYALCLIGGAAMLVRIGQRRAAVMLALLVLLYQWDTTLHTETSAYLGTGGQWVAAAWLAGFVGKIYALGWALRVRFAPRVVAAAIVGAVGLAVGPHVLPALGGPNAGALVGVWVFALGALYQPSEGIQSLVELTEWGHTVLKRVTRVAWALSGALLLAHLLFLASDHAIAFSSALPALPLLYLRRVRSEARMWGVVFATLLSVAIALPGALAVTAVVAAAALCLRALSPTFRVPPAPSGPEPTSAQPYRANGASASVPDSTNVCAAVESPDRLRSFTGACFALYLAAWTFHWHGGPWPTHVLALDLAATLGVALAVLTLRLRAPLLPLAASYVHFVVQAQLIPAPQSLAEWGASSIALGFVLLAGGLAVSYRLRRSPTVPLPTMDRTVSV